MFGYQIQRWADAAASRYGAPVYLCGSALATGEPNDYDVRVVMAEPDLARMFGRDDSDDPRPIDAITTPRQWKRLREQLKQSRRLSRLLQRNVDFQIQSEADQARYQNKPKVRLDRAPEGFFDAGRDDP